MTTPAAPTTAGPRRGPAVVARTCAVVLLLAVLAACAAPGTGSSPTSGVDPAPGPSLPQLPPLPPDGAPPGPNAVSPQPVEQPRTVPYAHAQVSADGREVAVQLTLGPPCAVLGGVAVEETATTVRLTVTVGQVPGSGCTGPQPALGFPVVTTVRLAAPLGDRRLVDGGA